MTQIKEKKSLIFYSSITKGYFLIYIVWEPKVGNVNTPLFSLDGLLLL